MNLKIQCNCGAKYAFEVTPESATTPIQFICPNCGLDNSAAINLVIHQQLASAGGVGATQPKPEGHKPRARIQFGAQAATPIATAQPVATSRPVADPPPRAISLPPSAP